ncbi:hypothetical protein CRE_24935 [Caenorhabditis remanei]|uniref:Uncharacterized protein n=2 Tax=Caenorhabditis remanei TaxID=31234 RepID=E3MHU0_CAERE|nr:hypothetical protein CRE_24935 [Caenorhabditis remanei]
MHLSFCLLLFASLFGATVQKCCQYPLYIPPKMPLDYQPFTMPHKVQWNGCDQPMIMGCAINGGYSKYWFRILGNFSSIPDNIESFFPKMLLNHEKKFGSPDYIDIKCDTQTGLWYWDNPYNTWFKTRQYKEFCCNWAREVHAPGWPTKFSIPQSSPDFPESSLVSHWD